MHLHYLWRPRTRDPADEMVLETVLNGRADRLVTLTVKDFEVAWRFGLTISTPGAFLQELHEEKVSALKTEAYFRERQARGDLTAFDAWLETSPSTEPMPGDEL